MHTKNHHFLHGYTLLEIAISLTIAALLVAGIVVGGALLRTAEIRSIMKEADYYRGAVETFKLKYAGLPGDFIEAETQFAERSNCADNADTQRTCNGNGNGIINSGASGVTSGNEQFLFWQHLALAGFISGNYDGVEGSLGVFDIQPERNVPLSKLSTAVWSVLNQDYSASALNEYYQIDYGNFITIGIRETSSDPSYNGWNFMPAITPEESFYIDQKIDDGRPGTGKLVVRYWSLPNLTTHDPDRSCTEATNGADFEAGYNLTNKNAACQPQFINAF